MVGFRVQASGSRTRSYTLANDVPEHLILLKSRILVWVTKVPSKPEAGIAYLTRDWAEMARRSQAALDQAGFPVFAISIDSKVTLAKGVTTPPK